jgi:hypothetical protein
MVLSQAEGEAMNTSTPSGLRRLRPRHFLAGTLVAYFHVGVGS